MQVGSYAYRVLRPARTLRSAVLTRDGELRVTRRDALRMLALAELTGGRTLVDFPLRDERGTPFDLVLAEDTLRFPPARWSDVRQRLGAGRRELHGAATSTPAALSPTALPSTARSSTARSSAARSFTRRHPEPARHALLLTVDANRLDLARLRAGALDLGYIRVVIVDS